MREVNAKISVIIPVYNTMEYLPELIAALQGQSLRSIECWFIDDGSTDGSAEYIESLMAENPEFKLLKQKHKGVAEARNLGLSYATGEYVFFCDSDDLIPKRALEFLYKDATLQEADIAVGKMVEFSIRKKIKYPQAERLSRLALIDPLDPDFIYSLTLCNKLIKRTIIEDNNIRFTDHKMGEDAIFMQKCLGCAEKIVGCKHLVYRYRQHESFETFSATDKVDVETIRSHYSSLELVREELMENLGKQAKKLYSDNREAADDYIKGKAFILNKTVNRRLAGLPMNRYYSFFWGLNDEGRALLKDNYKKYMGMLDPYDQSSVKNYLSVLLDSNGNPKSKETLLNNPDVSVIVSDKADKETALRILKSLYSQPFPCFEVIIPEKHKAYIEQSIGMKENITTVDDSSGYLRSAILTAKASYINIMEDRIYHNDDSLKKMWETAAASYADFISFNFIGVAENKEKRTLKAIDILFDERIVEDPNHETPLNVLDCSLNNKVFKKRALLQNEDILAKSSRQIARQAFERMSFERCIATPDENELQLKSDQSDPRQMLCFETESFFSYGLSKSNLSSLDKELNTALDEKKEWQPSVVFRAKRKLDRKRGIIYASKGKGRVENRVLFFTNRNQGGLSSNLQLVYDSLEGVDRIVFSEALPHSRAYNEKLKDALLTSKVIVTDDYCSCLRTTKLHEKQTVVQLWHACGAFKKFGLDLVAADIPNELKTHSQYSLVSVSSEFIRPIYAGAFGINKNVVKALGVPRTDILLNKDLMEAKKQSLIEQNPAIRGKYVILYAPTFRQKNGVQVVFDTQIKWKELSNRLPDDAIVIVKRHPLENRSLVDGCYDNIIELESADDLSALAAADLLITDYSSVVFDFVLLDKPVLFYTPDIKEYESGFYLNYPDDFGDNLVDNPDEFIDAVVSSIGNKNNSSKELREKYMGACDGHSTDRIANYIRKALNK